MKSFIELLCAILYAPVLLLRNEGPLRIVIYYHGVAAEDLARFSKQMAYLAQNCSVVQPSKIKTADSNGAGAIVAITFDDQKTSVDQITKYLSKRGCPVSGKPRWLE